VAAGGAAQPAAPAAVVDDFEDVSGWLAHPADGVELAIRSDTGWRGRALRLDFRFLGGGGYAVIHKAYAVDLPENYAFSFRIRGQAPPNHLEFKLIDSTGENVWWSVRHDVRFPAEWETFTIKKRHLGFAWGPLGGGDIRLVAAIEFAITAGSGGAGTVWIDDLDLTPLPPPGATPTPPVAGASSARPGYGAQLALDGDPATFWWCERRDARPWIALDFGAARECGGLSIDWLPGRHATRYVVEASDDATTWRTLRQVRDGNGGRDDLYLPESESRYLRLRVLRSASRAGPAIGGLTLQPLEWSASRPSFFQAIARNAPRGCFPRGISGEQSYWTVVGVDGDGRESLLSEDGMLETGKGGPSLEPFLLLAGGRLATWSHVLAEQYLEEGCLPIPSVKWRLGDLSLTVTAFGTGPAGASSVVGRYRVANHGARRTRLTLFLALRPFQVNPPSQALNLPGGTAPIRDLAFQGRTLRVNGERAVVCLTRPARFGAATFDAGDIVADYLRAGRMPSRTDAEDTFEAASGALAFPLDLPAGCEREVDVLVPLYPASKVPSVASGAAARAWVEEELARSRSAWEALAAPVTIALPDSASHVVQTLASQLAYILVNRAGPAIQPGARSYARSWIRDGALTSSALLRLGNPSVVREFIDWFAPHQYANGKVPCVVDGRGADPVPEHDSSGEFVFLVAEYYRYTRDRALAERMWPRILGAVSYLDSLRQQCRSAEFVAPDKRAFYGLLPPSISHEGYSAKPMHSYWDDFWALRAFKDAAFLAAELGHAAERARLEAWRDDFQHDLAASLQAAMRQHGIDYIPGCADLGDFDPTSTTIALAPGGAASLLPPEALRRTFERYYEFFAARRAGARWEAFTPYEMRNIGAFVRLGWRERAQELLDFFLAHQRPAGWRQWPEVVWREARAPHFLGDLPHTWVGSDFARSLLDMLAYEREADGALVIGAGVPVAWARQAPGVMVRDLRTPYGPLTYTMRLDGDAVEVRIAAGLRVPSGGIVVCPPLAERMRRATINGLPAPPGPELVARDLPATVILRP